MKKTLTILLAAMALPCMAQTQKAANPVKKTAGRAQIVQVQRQERLVLRTGQKSMNANASFYPDDIELLLDDSMWRKLEDLMASPFGKTLKVTDVYGFAVNIAKARVFDHEGLMFTMGTRNVTITAEDLNKLKRK